ncbi:hypothetical protein DLAC_11490 [Tieghemostelium lacteum]|uniref:Uncharacterized protein n=1 Tax=Tieghemostelium lacteum TaxID=361077 RepID=A0A152A661_TIELA|nr:hypothetical protein DLAC_11490 [Tieghemostelium lacteum]|eukprot:KYR01710.1 hypothetical protein DLAC_11490 [Tieghemostelium lacteum]
MNYSQFITQKSFFQSKVHDMTLGQQQNTDDSSPVASANYQHILHSNLYEPVSFEIGINAIHYDPKTHVISLIPPIHINNNNNNNTTTTTTTTTSTSTNSNISTSPTTSTSSSPSEHLSTTRTSPNPVHFVPISPIKKHQNILSNSKDKATSPPPPQTQPFSLSLSSSSSTTSNTIPSINSSPSLIPSPTPMIQTTTSSSKVPRGQSTKITNNYYTQPPPESTTSNGITITNNIIINNNNNNNSNNNNNNSNSTKSSPIITENQMICPEFKWENFPQYNTPLYSSPTTEIFTDFNVSVFNNNKSDNFTQKSSHFKDHIILGLENKINMECELKGSLQSWNNDGTIEQNPKLYINFKNSLLYVFSFHFTLSILWFRDQYSDPISLENAFSHQVGPDGKSNYITPVNNNGRAKWDGLSFSPHILDPLASLPTFQQQQLNHNSSSNHTHFQLQSQQFYKIVVTLNGRIPNQDPSYSNGFILVPILSLNSPIQSF